MGERLAVFFLFLVGTPLFMAAGLGFVWFWIWVGTTTASVTGDSVIGVIVGLGGGLGSAIGAFAALNMPGKPHA